MRFLAAFALCLLSFSLGPLLSSAHAQTTVAVSDQLSQRADDVMRLMRGEPIEAEVFDENFLNAVPPAQFRALVQQVTAQHGKALAILTIDPRSANAGTIKIGFEKSVGTVNIDLEASPSHRISGLFLTGFEAAGSSVDEVLAKIDALPGRQGLLIRDLDSSEKAPIASLDPDGRYAIASAAKLYILAALDRSIQTGERQWSDVVPLGPKSHPSGITQNWPDRSPVTLHTLATLMISVSDNSATDTLIRVLGLNELAAIVAATGHHNPEDLRPFLMTRQASALKMPVHADRRAKFLSAGSAERERLLEGFDDALTLDSLDFRVLTSKPNYIDQLEWFATPSDMLGLLAYLQRYASDEAKALLAINPGMGPDAAQKWDYFGYKGGSEPGVLSYNFLLRSKSGKSYGVSVNWNNAEQSLQESELLTLTTRLVNLLTER
ncbi:MAG: serine hydrolase [Sphingopyxis sp.]|nr:MAG: serine hydrolase [Sphingopyxis sp.]